MAIQPMSSADITAISDGDSNARKCVVIKKKKIGDDMEKIEMRFVSYNKIVKGSKASHIDIITEASSYLKEKAKEIDYQSSHTPNGSCRTENSESKPSATEKDKRKLCLCIPVLTKLRTSFDDLEQDKKASNHTRRQCGTLKALIDEILSEAAYTLDNGHPVHQDLLKKVQNINNLARKVLMKGSTVETLVQDENELAVSKSRTSPSRL
ncbi:unnamed protein product [Caenorhabditis bovis]|uniref:Uncharacterized protein n=1 Tax=Caenorhabditis bovis TaxID=2654633 RepID=A0A8S1ECM9_9PELO|nr:unnamed protein product [Caenorhabditis bovis]